MEKSSVQQFSHTGKSSTPKQAVSEMNHEANSKGISDGEVKENHKNAEDVGKGLAEVGVVESNSVSVDKSRDTGLSAENPSCESSPEDPAINSSMELPAEGLTRKISSPKKTISEVHYEFGFGSGSSEVLERRQAVGIESVVQSGSVEIRPVVCESIVVVKLGPSPKEAERDSCLEHLKPPTEDLTMKSALEQLELPPEGTSGSPPDDTSKCPGLEHVGATQDDEAKKSSQPGHGKKGRPRKEKYISTSLVGSTRVLRSRSQEKSKTLEPVNDSTEDAGSREMKRKKKKKKKQMKKIPNDEFSKIRKHLRYLLTRMNYEQNLIDAYSGEGWKGQSLEKIKPEKELQRAKSEILRCKLKIRDIFQRIDMSCAEGRLPESLFDSEGQIDSEDIFCAKCGSADVRADNDIILCDGVCERGFHQFCLEPPLLKEQVPPGDEGWLCPACDCKADCIDSLNDSQGTTLSISYGWEKVFPEAATAGNKLDDNLGLSSDDSEDDDYNPDGPELDEKVEREDSSSDESDFYSASDDLGAVTKNKQYLGLPSDDSEDDDYDPDKVGLDEQVKQESSSSDFTSASEDISVVFKDDGPLAEVQGPSVSDQIKGNGERSKIDGTKRPPISDELLTLLESNLGDSVSAPISGKRHVERLDYKKLHDEAYGCNVSSDSSDEDFTDTAAPKRRKDNTGKSVPSTRKTPNLKRGTDAEGLNTKHDQKQSECTPTKRTGQKLDVEGTSSSPEKSHKGSSELGSSNRGTTRPTYKKLGEAVTQRLYESFKENQYPERSIKENLAKELMLTFQQVNKWFENARWSFRHHDKGTQVNKAPHESGMRMAVKNATCNGVEEKEPYEASPGNLATKQGNTESSRTAKFRNNKKVKSDQETDPISSVQGTPKQNALVDSPKAEGVRRSGRIHSRSGGNSVS